MMKKKHIQSGIILWIAIAVLLQVQSIKTATLSTRNIIVKLAYDSDLNTNLYKNTLNALSIANMFVSKLIKIQYDPVNDYLSIPAKEISCRGYPIPQTIQDNSQKYIDVYVFVKNKASLDTKADGEQCIFYQRPLFGNLQIDFVALEQIFTDNNNNIPKVTENIVHLLLRQLLKILIFDRSLLSKYKSSDISTYVITTNVGGKGTGKVLNFPSVKAAAKNFFACDTLLGAPLENELSTLSRWEATLLMEDLMSSTDIILDQDNIRLKFSALDAALFTDLGFYYVTYNTNYIFQLQLFFFNNPPLDVFQSIDTSLVEQMTYGYQRGCGFFQSGCQQYPVTQSSSIEFCIPNGVKGCNAWGTTRSECNQIEQLNYCYSYSYPQAKGALPKCSSSKLCFLQEDTTKDASCNTAVVLISASNVISIYFPDSISKLSCISDGQILVDADQSTIRCPDNIKLYADNLILQSCQNSCSGNGICNNGKCLCLSGFFGIDCATKIESPPPIDQFSYSIGISSSTSLSACPSGYKSSTSTSTLIDQNPVTLNQCICSFTNGCELCYYAQMHSCQKCSLGYYLTTDTHICIFCGTGCATCSYDSPDTKCLTCNPGYHLDNEDKCSKCEDNYYYDNVTCQKCLLGCDNCIDKFKCSKCSANNSFNVAKDSPDRICYVDCGVGKAAITKATDDNFNICDSCSDSLTNCIACHYQIITDPIFEMVCDKCGNNFAQDITKPDKPCTICADTFYLVKVTGSPDKCSSCVQDHCLQCKSPTECTACSTGYYVKDGKCVQECGLGYYIKSKQICTKCIEFCDVCEDGESCKVCSNSMYFETLPDKTTGCLSSTSKCDSSCIRCISPKDANTQSQQCGACDVDLVLVPNYTFSQQSTAITGLIIGQCRTHCFEDQREIPQATYSSLNYKMCFYCDNSEICRKCTSTGGCSQCENENNHYLDTDTATCLPWAITCIEKDSTLGCVGCYNKNYFGYKNNCVKQCPEGYETGILGDGKYCKKTSCNALCSTCIGSGYQDCVTCPKTRKLQAFHGSFAGTCECESDDFTDTNEPECQNSKDEYNFKVGSYTLAALSLTFSAISSILLSSPMLFFFLADQSQSIGQLTYINDKHPYDVDDSMFCYKLFNLNILLPSPIVSEKLSQDSLDKSSSKRLLDSINVQEYRGDINRDKITDFHKSKDFVYAGFWALILVILVWATKLCAHLLISKKQTKVVAWGSSFTPSKIYTNKGDQKNPAYPTPSKIYNITPQEEQSSQETPDDEKQNKLLYVLNEYCAGLLPYIVFILTVSELSLLAFQNFHAQSDKNTFSSFESFSIVVACLYIIAAATYIFYLALQNKEGLIYSLFEEMRQGTMFFFLVLVLKKISQSIFIVFLSSDPQKQVFSVVIIEAVFLFYIVMVRPFRRETYFNLIFGIGEFLVFLIMVMYTAMSISDSASTQSGCAKAILIFSMLLMCHHMISGVFYIIKFHKFFVEWLKKRREAGSKTEEKDSKNSLENAKQHEQQQGIKYLETPFGEQKNNKISNPPNQKEQQGVFMEIPNRNIHTKGLAVNNEPQPINSDQSNIFQTPYRQPNNGADNQGNNIINPRDIFNTLGSPDEGFNPQDQGTKNKELFSDQQYHKQGSKDLLLN